MELRRTRMERRAGLGLGRQRLAVVVGLRGPSDRRVGDCAVDDVVTAAGDDRRVDPHEVRLLPRQPREQRQVLGFEHLLHALDRAGMPLHHDAPCGAFGGLVSVDLEGHEPVEYGARQLRAGGAAKNDAAVVDHEVDREDVGLTGHVDGETPDRSVIEQLPTLGLAEDLCGFLSGVHPVILAHLRGARQGRTSRGPQPAPPDQPSCTLSNWWGTTALQPSASRRRASASLASGSPWTTNTVSGSPGSARTHAASPSASACTDSERSTSISARTGTYLPSIFTDRAPSAS